MRPSFPLEHFEHGYLLGIERIALDLLQLHADEPPLASDGNFLIGQSIHYPTLTGSVTANWRVSCQTSRLLRNVVKALLMGPFFPLEHLEHGNVVGIERIARDLLQRHGDKPALPGDRNFFISQ
jgi:hypothetical protein